MFDYRQLFSVKRVEEMPRGIIVLAAGTATAGAFAVKKVTAGKHVIYSGEQTVSRDADKKMSHSVRFRRNKKLGYIVIIEINQCASSFVCVVNHTEHFIVKACPITVGVQRGVFINSFFH